MMPSNKSSSTRWFRALRPAKYNQTLAANVTDDNQQAREIKTLYTNDEGAERISKKTLLVMVDKMDTTIQKKLLGLNGRQGC
jgi:hypothetical protein